MIQDVENTIYGTEIAKEERDSFLKENVKSKKFLT